LKRDLSAIHYGFFQTGKKGKRHTHTQPHQITSISPYASDKPNEKKSLNRCANEKKKKIFSFFFLFFPLAESFDRRLFNYQTTTSFELLPIYSLSPLLVLERLQLVGKYKSPRKKRKEKKRRGTTAIKSRRWSASETDDNNQVNNITKKEVPL
jgi:hypothetical protein